VPDWEAVVAQNLKELDWKCRRKTKSPLNSPHQNPMAAGPSDLHYGFDFAHDSAASHQSAPGTIAFSRAHHGFPPNSLVEGSGRCNLPLLVGSLATLRRCRSFPVPPFRRHASRLRSGEPVPFDCHALRILLCVAGEYRHRQELLRNAALALLRTGHGKLDHGARTRFDPRSLAFFSTSGTTATTAPDIKENPSNTGHSWDAPIFAVIGRQEKTQACDIACG
jgi:hypothetical protein